jgi:hypothetical protein
MHYIVCNWEEIMPLANKKALEKVDYNGLTLALVEETLSDGSKVYNVVIHTQGEYSLDYPSDGAATAAFMTLKGIIR